jgi:hypothetical protein
VDTELDDAIVSSQPPDHLSGPGPEGGPRAALCNGDVLEVWRSWAQTSGAERSTLALPGR